MVTGFMVLITIVTGAYKPTNITGGPHIVGMEYVDVFHETKTEATNDQPPAPSRSW